AGGDRGGCPKCAGQIELFLLQVDGGDFAGATMANELEHQQTDRAGAVDQDVRAERDLEALESVDHTRERLDERSDLVVHLADPIDVGSRRDDVVGENAGAGAPRPGGDAPAGQLVPANQGQGAPEVPVEDVLVCPADATRVDTDQDIL